MGNSASSLPYSVGKEVSTTERWYGFAIHEGTHKVDGTPVTIFRANKKELASMNLIPSVKNCQDAYGPALHHMQTSLKLVHPFLLKVHSIMDTDNPTANPPDFTSSNREQALSGSSSSSGEWIIVTEHVMSLEEYLEDLRSSSEKERQDALAWGMYGIVQALHFVHESCQSAHGNLQPSSIFVTAAGDFKLSGFQLLTPIGIVSDGHVGPTLHFKDYERDVTPKPYRCPERLSASWDVLTELPPHVMDSYALGVLLEDLYTSYTQTGVPAVLQKAIVRLQTPHARMRPRVKPLEKCPLFTSNDFIQTMQGLSNLLTQSTSEQVYFLTSKFKLDLFRKAHCIYKIYPLLQQLLFHTLSTHTNAADGLLQLHDDLSRRLVMSCIHHLFSIIDTHLSFSPHQQQAERDQLRPYWTLLVQPLVVKLFPMADRGIRGALLQRISLLEKGFAEDSKILNTIIFEPMCSGFTDSAAPLRELTLKSCTSLVPHLTPTNRDKLSRYLVRLQSDPEPSIRTNAMIFIGKMVSSNQKMQKEKMEKLLLPAFERAIHDDFLPCRLASLKTIHSIRSQIAPQLLAQKVVPLIIPHTLDPTSHQVRAESWKVLDILTTILRQESERLDHTTTPNTTTPNTTTTTTTSTTPSSSSNIQTESSSASGSGYLSSWGLSWGSSSTSSAPATTTTTAMSSVSAPKVAESTTMTQQPVKIAGGWSDDEDDHWDDDDDDDNIPIQPVPVKTSVPNAMKLKKQPTVQKLKPTTGGVNLDGWDDF